MGEMSKSIYRARPINQLTAYTYDFERLIT